jgi:hypothetical protein
MLVQRSSATRELMRPELERGLHFQFSFRLRPQRLAQAFRRRGNLIPPLIAPSFASGVCIILSPHFVHKDALALSNSLRTTTMLKPP